MDITAVVSAKSADYIQGLVEDAASKGADLKQVYSRFRLSSPTLIPNSLAPTLIPNSHPQLSRPNSPTPLPLTPKP